MNNIKHCKPILLTQLLGVLLTACQIMPEQPTENIAEITSALEDSLEKYGESRSLNPPSEVTAALLPRCRAIWERSVPFTNHALTSRLTTAGHENFSWGWSRERLSIWSFTRM